MYLAAPNKTKANKSAQDKTAQTGDESGDTRCISEAGITAAQACAVRTRSGLSEAQIYMIKNIILKLEYYFMAPDKNSRLTSNIKIL